MSYTNAAITVRSHIVTAANTTATRFPDLPARRVTIRVRTGTFKILGTSGGILDADGFTITTTSVPLGLDCINLNLLGYQASNVNDVLEIIREI